MTFLKKIRLAYFRGFSVGLSDKLFALLMLKNSSNLMSLTCILEVFLIKFCDPLSSVNYLAQPSSLYVLSYKLIGDIYSLITESPR